ncbi:MAG: methylated-DNA--[protein]-cysteine S-methyltransferase [Micrococcales bacterium]|nr:methylated-DNA--[protein]-cysteine S-methyltransferase [Micrococcales bacterium]MCL2667158.1 methylated-DNA--[protein]-cysteine S-methyltransferase [Micrococcales bacterium]
MRHTTVSSALGLLTLVADGGVLTGVYFEGHHPAPAPARLGPYVEPDATFVVARAQIDEYLGGRRQVFDIPTQAVGTPFQQSVWTALAQVPYGDRTTYGALAGAVGRPTAARAVGAAVGRNPLSIVVPCHRVVGSAGLTGYAGGLDRKRHLLDLESALDNRVNIR